MQPASVSASLLGKDADDHWAATGQTQSMPRRGSSVLFAALLLVAQLLFGVMSAEAATHGGEQHCGGCPSADSSGLGHDIGSVGKDCGSHCADSGSAGHPQPHGCGSGCSMVGSSHCGGSTSPALHASTFPAFEVTTVTYDGDRRSVDLPDSPLFDFLRPPTRG